MNETCVSAKENTFQKWINENGFDFHSPNRKVIIYQNIWKWRIDVGIVFSFPKGIAPGGCCILSRFALSHSFRQVTFLLLVLIRGRREAARSFRFPAPHNQPTCPPRLIGKKSTRRIFYLAPTRIREGPFIHGYF